MFSISKKKTCLAKLVMVLIPALDYIANSFNKT